MKLSASTLAALFFLSGQSAGFTSSKPSHRLSTSLYGEDFKTVKEELKEKTSLVDAEDEIKYGQSSGEEKQDLSIPADMRDTIDRLTKPRAYPLFLAEKGAMIVEDIASSFSKKDEPTTNGASKKERIVILGTGWGSAAFLKEINTDKYDVTVISPRNHFLFTPMLAGASVGTVEYRSITESIREVC